MLMFITILITILNLILPLTPLYAQSTISVDAAEEEYTILSQTEKIVKAVEIKGNKTIGIATILSRIKTRVGQEYIQNVISDDLKRLYNTGYFSHASVDREDYEGGFKVIFYVVEKAIVDKVTFSRLRHYNPKTLMKKIKTKEGKFLDDKTLEDDIRTLEELYIKKGLTLVSVRAEKDIDELTNKAKVHFVIKEGRRIKVKRINIEGNQFFKDKRIFKVIKSRPDSLFTSGYLKEEILKEDMERIKSFYEKEGFIDAEAYYEYQDMETGRLVVNIYINEGKQYYVEKITVSGNDVLSDQEILNIMTEVKEGTVFSREKLTVDLSLIQTRYFDRGYIFANIRESTSLNAATGKVVIKLDVHEGEVAYINRVRVQGNDRTRDIVIRRELRLYPGDRFDGAKLRRSKERLRNLGYFEDIGYDVKDTGIPNRKDLVVQVKEAKTGTFSFGGGYSTVDQLVGFVEIQQRNFDFTNWPTFTGGGQHLSLRTETGTTRNNMRLSFTEPWWFDYPVSVGFDAYRNERERERDVGYANDETRVGGVLRLGKQFTDYVSGRTSYRREKIKIENFDDDVSADLLAEEGTNVVSVVSFSLSRDSRDNVFSPTKGLYVGGTTDVATKLFDGDKEFVRFTTRTSYFVPFKFDSVVEFRLKAGVVNAYGDSDKVPIFERFFAGGARTIRGYNERKVGPLDSITEDPIGGESMLIGNIEYTIPLMQVVKFATFFDGGNVWSEVNDFGSGDFKSGVGIGFRIKTPIGPVNLDYGYPLNDEPGEEERTGKFYFSVSRGF